MSDPNLNVPIRYPIILEKPFNKNPGRRYTGMPRSGSTSGFPLWIEVAYGK